MALSTTVRARNFQRNVFTTCLAILCLGFASGAEAQVSWKHIGTVTTLTANQLCYTDGTNVICDATAPTDSAGLLGLGSTAPIVSLDMSKKSDALALPVGTTGTRPTGANLTNGEIRYNSSTPGVEAYVNGSWATLTAGGATGTGTANYEARWLTGTTLGTGAIYDNGTQVGIGTTTLTNPLTISSVSGYGISVNSGGTSSLQISYDELKSISNALYLNANSNQNVLIANGGGSVGIGTTSPGGQLQVVGNSSNTSTNFYATEITGIQSGNNIQGYIGVFINPNYVAAAGNTLTGLIGEQSTPALNSAGTVTNLIADQAQPTNVNTGTVSSMYAIQARPSNGSTGTVSTMYGLYSQCQSKVSGGTVSTCYEAYLDVPQTTGTITTKYGLYQADGASDNFFAGSVGIGTTAPGGTLEVDASSSSTIGAVIKGAASQSTSLLQFENGSGATIASVTSGGRFAASSGSASSAGLTFAADGTTGLFLPSVGNLAFTTNGATAMTITSAGSVGVGTTAVPTGVTASVNGPVQVAGTGSEACSSSTVGAMRYNSAGGYMQICTYP